MYPYGLYRHNICRHGRPPPRHSPLLRRRRLHPALRNVHQSVFTCDNILLHVIYCIGTYLYDAHDTVRQRWLQQ